MLCISFARGVTPLCRQYEEELAHLRSQLAQKTELLQNSAMDETLRYRIVGHTEERKIRRPAAT
jgi:hypothetical protein